MEDGTTTAMLIELPPNSRTTVPMGAPAPFGFGQFVAGRKFATVVESVDTGNGLPQIAVERAMYSSTGGVPWAAGTDALATRLR